MAVQPRAGSSREKHRLFDESACYETMASSARPSLPEGRAEEAIFRSSGCFNSSVERMAALHPSDARAESPKAAFRIRMALRMEVGRLSRHCHQAGSIR